MSKILLALGLTLAASSGAFARSTALDAYVPQARSETAASIDYTATASIGAESNDQIIYHRSGNDGSPTFKPRTPGTIDYTPTASIGGGGDIQQDKIIYHRSGNDGSPTFLD
ncbi:hypothetical protein [uncultured Hoeflea sp.]|uniref:hypothetical protein n=1 Tax=uncultured Hoeflea sp. TaxID=538666 RepID=UPI00261ED6B7|nr:hypothetical protein [uncultured Hoeflea sp.]